MGAVEHLKTLCCLGLKPESAMIAVTPLLHEIIPHSWGRLALIAPDASWTASYSENPAAAALYRERFGTLMQDPTGLGPLYLPAVRAVGIGWTLPLQGRNWLERAWFKEIEAPLDACWILDTMIGDGGRTIALVHLLRPRCARPYTADDAQRLDQLRPWLAHAFRSQTPDAVETGDTTPPSPAAALARSGQMILQTDTTVIWQTPSVEFFAPDPRRRAFQLPASAAKARCAARANLKPRSPSDRRGKWEPMQAAAHADLNRLWRSHARSQMAHARGCHSR
jgi:hypothetical protein